MNTDFVPLSSLLESMKAPSFEGISTDTTDTTIKQKPDNNSGEKPQSSSAPAPKTKEPAPAANPEPPPAPEPEKVCKEPKILVDREGDKISKIRVLCSCGQSIVLDCNYSN